MMRMVTFLLLFGIGLFPCVVRAQDTRRLPPLSNSMSFHDVLKAWGAPQDKQELEAKRQDIWVYPAARVIFQNGRVAAWFQEGATLVDALPVKPPKEVVAANDGADGEDSAVEEILRDILKEPPAPSTTVKKNERDQKRGKKEDQDDGDE